MRIWIGVALAAALAVAGPAAATGKKTSVNPAEVCKSGSEASSEEIVAACSQLLSGPEGAGMRRGHYRALRGETLMTLGRTAEALSDLDLALKDDPDNLEALTVRGRLEITLGRRDAAQADIDHALTLAPDDAGVLVSAGELAEARGETDKARQYFDRVIALSPDWFIGYFDRGRLLLDAGDAKGALVDLDKAALLTPPSSLVQAFVLAARAGAKFVLGDLDGANADLAVALKAQPNNPLALVMRGQIRFQQGQQAAGLADVSTAIALLPDNPSLLSARAMLRLSASGPLSQADLEAALADLNAALALRPEVRDMANKAYVLELLNRFPEALAAIDQALGARSDDEALYGRRGEILLVLNRREEARAAFDKGLAIRPSGPLWLGRAQTWGPDQVDSVISDLDHALALQPDLAPARRARLLALIYLNRVDEADVTIADLLRTAANDPDTYFMRSQVRERRGQYADAVADQTQALTMAGDKAEYLNERCWTRAVWGQQLNEALADCDAVLKLSPGSASYLDSRGLVRLRLGQYDQAIADYEAALAKAPKQPTSLYGRGLAKLRLGRTAEGQADLAAAQALEPKTAGRFAGWGLTP